MSTVLENYWGACAPSDPQLSPAWSGVYRSGLLLPPAALLSNKTHSSGDAAGTRSSVGNRPQGQMSGLAPGVGGCAEEIAQFRAQLQKCYHTESILRAQLIVEWTPKEHSRTSQTWERRMRSCVRRSAGTASGAPPLLGRNPGGRREKGRGENLLAFLLGLGVRWLATSSSMLRVDSSPTATAALGVRVPPCDHMHRLRKRVTNVSVHRFESGHNWIRIQTINFYLYGAKSHPKTSQGALDNQKKTNSLLNE